MVWTPSSINNLRTKQGTRIEKLYYELNGVRTEFVAPVKYFGEPGDADIWRIFVNPSNQLVRQRYENDTWVDYGADGSSTSFTDIILRGTEYGLYSQDILGVRRPLVRTAFSDEKGLAAGTTDGVLAIIHDGTAASFEKGAAYDTTVNDGSDIYLLTEYEEIFTPSISSFIDSTYFYIDSVPAGTKVRVSSTSTASGNILYENVSEYEFSKGLGNDVTTGANEITIDPTAFREVSDKEYLFKLEFSNEVGLIGKQNGTFLAKLRDVGYYAEITSIVNIPSWKNLYDANSGTFAVDDIIYEDHYIYICNEAGAQATDFATNISKWDSLGDAIIIKKGAVGGQSLYGGLSAGDDLNLSSTADATKGNINLGANSTYDELNDRLGLNTTTPAKTLDVDGDVNITGFTKLGDDPYCEPLKIACYETTLDSDSQTLIPHGLDWTKIMFIRTAIFDGSVWWYGEYNDVVVPARTVKLKYDATNIIIDAVGTAFYGQPQKTIIVYHE